MSTDIGHAHSTALENHYRRALERIAELDGNKYYVGVMDGYSRHDVNAPSVARINITVGELAAIAVEALGRSINSMYVDQDHS
jgi:hypothetical protein